MMDVTEHLIGSLAAILNALTVREVQISMTVSGNIMVRDPEGKKIGKVTTENGEWVVA